MPRCSAGTDGEEHNKHEKAGEPDQGIDQQSDKTAADAGQGHLDVHQLRRINVKLIWVNLI